MCRFEFTDKNEFTAPLKSICPLEFGTVEREQKGTLLNLI